MRALAGRQCIAMLRPNTMKKPQFICGFLPFFRSIDAEFMKIAESDSASVAFPRISLPQPDAGRLAVSRITASPPLSQLQYASFQRRSRNSFTGKISTPPRILGSGAVHTRILCLNSPSSAIAKRPLMCRRSGISCAFTSMAQSSPSIKSTSLPS